jgi:hypothetical protein
VGTGPYVEIPTVGKRANDVPPKSKAPNDVQYTLTLPCGAKYAEGGFSDVWILVTYDPYSIRKLFDDIDDLKTGTRPDGNDTSAIYLVVHPESLSWVYPFFERNDFYFHHYSNANKDKETGLHLRATGRYVYCYNRFGKAHSYATSIQGVHCILKTTDDMFMGVLEKDKLKGISGALDIGESLQDTIVAELLEEIGLEIKRIESGALFRFGGHVQHKARDDLINDNMGSYVLTLELTSTDVKNAFVSAADQDLLDKEVSGIFMIPTSGPFTLDSSRIFDYDGNTINPNDEMKTWILKDLNAMYHAKIGSVVPGLVAEIHDSKVAFSPGTLQIEKVTPHFSIRAMALGVDAESPDIMFDETALHTSPQFQREPIPQKFWDNLAKINEFVERMGAAKTLRVARDVHGTKRLPFMCHTTLTSWRAVQGSLTRTTLEENQYLNDHMIMKKKDSTARLFVDPSSLSFNGTQPCFSTLVWSNGDATKETIWCIIAIPERLYDGAKTIPSGIFKYTGDRKNLTGTPCTVLSRFQNTAAVTLRNVNSQMTWTLGNTPFHEGLKTLWIGGGGGNDVVSSCLVARPYDVVMNSIGIRQFVNKSMTSSDTNAKFFETFYTHVPKNTYVINISEIARKTQETKLYVQKGELNDTGTINFEVEMALTNPKLTVMVCILPFVHKDLEALQKEKDAALRDRNVKRMKDLFPELFTGDTLTLLNGTSSVYTSETWKGLMKSQIKHVSNVVVVDTGGDIVTGGNDIRPEGADTLWIPLMKEMSSDGQ